MAERIQEFTEQFKETNFSLKDYVDFPKIIANVDAISIKLNQLNYLIGQEDMESAVKLLWDELSGQKIERKPLMKTEIAYY